VYRGDIDVWYEENTKIQMAIYLANGHIKMIFTDNCIFDTPHG
jgi:hypothetical protein